MIYAEVLVHNNCVENSIIIAKKSNYKKLFLEKSPDVPSGYHVHYTFPDKYLDMVDG